MGLGQHGGAVGAARWLAAQGAQLTITDLADESTLAESLAALGKLPIAQLRLGQHVEEDFIGADAVIVNPAVRPGHWLVELARHRGAQILSEIELFLNACPAPILGVTGSNGKSTTADMLAAILQADGRHTWLGGNIGGSLLDDLDCIRPDDWVVLELSSFQLHYLSPAARLPEVAIVTNCSPNHLDWHDCYEHYVAAKQRLLAGPRGAAVLNTHDAEVAAWHRQTSRQVWPLVSAQSLPPLQVPGAHNRINSACAATAALGIGCRDSAIQAALSQYRGLPHRIEFVGEVAGRRFYNDSKATTPQATLAALAAFDTPLWLLAGGYDKGSDYSAHAHRIAAQVRGAAFFGSAGPHFHELTREHSAKLPIALHETLGEALAWCWQRSSPGDTILLSPACASFDQFRDFVHRGTTFATLVHELASGRVGS